MSLTQLPAATVKLITTSQIITSTSSAVKELFENALDAGATNVEVKLVNFGLDRIEVKDNGSGISKENTTCMALPHFTSKISNFSDLETLQTYGFRGEALNALCSVGQVTLTTATAADPMATVYTLDSSGNISATKPSHHVQGTTVTVANLFRNLPVRRQLMGSSRKAQEELKQVESVVKSLAVIKPNIRVTLSHNKCLIWQKTQCSDLSKSFSQLVGYSTGQQMEMLSLKVNDEVSVEMLVPKRDCDIAVIAKSTPVLSLVFVNGRPVVNKKILKVLHQQLIAKFGDNFSSRKFAVCLFSISVESSSVDVNLEPNKTKVLLKDEDEVLTEVEKHLQTYYNALQSLCPEKESGQKEPVRGHTPPLDTNDGTPRKKRKIDEDKFIDDFEDSTANNSPHPLPKMTKDWNMLEDSIDSEKSVVVPERSSRENRSEIKREEQHEASFESHQYSEEKHVPQEKHNNDNSFSIISDCYVTQQSKEKENIVNALSEDPVESEHWPRVQNEDSPGEVPTTSFYEAEKSMVDSLEIETNETANSNELDHLWDNVGADDINELSMCLDAIESASQLAAEAKPNKVGKEADIVGSVAWSMGHVSLPKGDIMKGSSVLVGRQLPSAGGMDGTVVGSGSLEVDTPVAAESIQTSIHVPSIEKESEIPSMQRKTPNQSPQKSPKNFLSQKSPRSSDLNKTSPGISSSLQSVSSQMGRRELAAFTKFAREVRPQIILENPGIAFTNVASMLTEKWQSLSTIEKEHYEEIARETATTKKIWKTLDKQKKLEWVKKLPEKKKVATPSRPPRKEVPNSISVDHIRDKFSKASLSIERDQQFYESKSGICLLGQLEPSGTWVCLEKSVLSILNHSRLQEVVINHRLLNTFALTMTPLPSMQRLDPVILGQDAWHLLVALPCKFDEFRQTRIISADIIVKNGFKIEVSSDNQHANLTEVAQALNYYGVKELKETLTLGSTWPVVELSDCRPLRVVNHIRSEAMRICRKSPTALSKTMVEELLEYWRTVMLPKDVNCLHAKPILTPVYNIVEKTQLFL